MQSQFWTADGATYYDKKGNGKGLTTVSDAIKQAGLDWRVSKVPAEYSGRQVPGYFFVIREDTGNILGSVGSDYHPIQNTDAFKFFDHVVKSEDLIIAGAGYIDYGRLVWVQAKLPHSFYVVEGDWVNSFLTLVWAHDGTRALSISHSPIRMLCNNMIPYVLTWIDGADNHGVPTVYVRHTKNASMQIRAAHYMLGLAANNNDLLAELFSSFARTPVHQGDIDDAAKFLFPSRPEILGGDPSWKTERLRGMFKENVELDINNQPGAEYTAWTIYNAATGLVDHTMPTRQNRIKMAWFGRGKTMKVRFLKWIVKRFLGVEME